MNRGNNADIRLDRRVSRIRSISDFFIRTESNASDTSLDEHAMDRGDDSDYFDDDVEDMEMEIEMSNGNAAAEESEVRFTGMLSMSSLNLQHHRGETAGIGNSQRKSSPPLTDNCAPQVRSSYT